MSEADVGRAYRQLNQEAARSSRNLVDHVLLTSDPTTRAVFAEDPAAVLGNGVSGFRPGPALPAP